MYRKYRREIRSAPQWNDRRTRATRTTRCGASRSHYAASFRRTEPLSSALRTPRATSGRRRRQLASDRSKAGGANERRRCRAIASSRRTCATSSSSGAGYCGGCRTRCRQWTLTAHRAASSLSAPIAPTHTSLRSSSVQLSGKTDDFNFLTNEIEEITNWTRALYLLEMYKDEAASDNYYCRNYITLYSCTNAEINGICIRNTVFDYPEKRS